MAESIQRISQQDADVYSQLNQEMNKLAYENERLRQWISELEAFIKTTTADTMPGSNWGKLKARLLSKRPEFLP